MTYGRPRSKPKPPIVPAFVALEKKVLLTFFSRLSLLLHFIISHNATHVIILFYQKTLRFYGYYKETVNDSPVENYRVRPIELLYYLEDDSMMVVEPKVEVIIIKYENK